MKDGKVQRPGSVRRAFKEMMQGTIRVQNKAVVKGIEGEMRYQEGWKDLKTGGEVARTMRKWHHKIKGREIFQK